MNIIFAPPWFFGYDIALQAVFFVVCLFVALSAWKLYRHSGSPRLWQFSLAFLLISLSYLTQALFNAIVVSTLRTTPEVGSIFALNLYLVGLYVNMLFIISGLVVLLYTTFKVEKPSIMWFLLLTSLLALVTSAQVFITFFLLEVVFLVFLTWFYWRNYNTKKARPALFVALAFALLLLGSIAFVFSVGRTWFYVAGHLLVLAGFGSILWSLWLLHEKKKSL